MKKILLALSIALVLGLSGCIPEYVEVDPPILLEPEVLSYSSVKLQWTHGGEEKYKQTAYTIQRKRENHPPRYFTSAIGASDFIDTELEGSTHYSYTIESQLVGLYSTSPSNEVTVETAADPNQLLEVPQNFSASLLAEDNRRIALAWDASENATSYAISLWSTTSNKRTELVENVTSYTINDVPLNTWYYFSVQAKNTELGTYSKNSDVKSIKTPLISYPDIDSAAPLLFNTNEHLIIPRNASNVPLWTAVVPQSEEFSLSVDSPDIIFRVYQRNEENILICIAFGTGSSEPAVLHNVACSALQTCYITFLSSKSTYSSYSNTYFIVKLTEGAAE